MSVSLLHYHHNSLGQVWCEVIVMVCYKFGPRTTDTSHTQLNIYIDTSRLSYLIHLCCELSCESATPFCYTVTASWRCGVEIFTTVYDTNRTNM